MEKSLYSTSIENLKGKILLTNNSDSKNQVQGIHMICSEIYKANLTFHQLHRLLTSTRCVGEIAAAIYTQMVNTVETIDDFKTAFGIIPPKSQMYKNLMSAYQKSFPSLVRYKTKKILNNYK